MRRLALAALVLAAAPVAPEPQGPAAPAWVREARPIAPADVAQADYAYLGWWLETRAQPADRYVLDLFRRHDVLVFGEGHNVREHKLFLIDLLPRLYHEAGVRCLGLEVTNPSQDAELEKLVNAPTEDAAARLDFARRQAAASWNSLEHWDLIEAVRRLNANLPPGAERMRLVGIDIVADWTDLYVRIKQRRPEDTGLAAIYESRDVTMAEHAEKATLARGAKAVLFVGRGHDETHLGAEGDPPYRRPIMANVLYRKYGERVRQVVLDWGDFPVVDRAWNGRPALPIGFDMPASPFATVLSGDMGPDRPMKALARSYVYFGPCGALHPNTPWRGFVDDAMFRQHERYYEIDFEQPFEGAKDTDDYLYARRWRIRCDALAGAVPAGTPAPGDVRLLQDVPYLEPGRTETLDLYLPARRWTSKAPALVMIHGGGFTSGDKARDREKNVCGTLASAGFACASVNYRLGAGSWPGNLHDVKNAVRFLRARARRYDVDPERIGVIGGSAGGTLALLVGLTAGQPDLEPEQPYPGVSSRVSAIVDMYGITNLLTRQETGPDGTPNGRLKDTALEVFGARATREATWRLASPVTHVTPASPPVLILHGTADTTVDRAQSTELAAVLKQQGVAHELLMLDGVGHTFDLQTWNGKPLPQDLRPVLLRFLMQHVAGRPAG